MTKKRIAGNLDALDLALIKELEINARQSSSDLAERIQSNERTIRRRLKRLLDEGLIQPITIIDPFALGFESVVVLGITVDRGQVDAVVEELVTAEKVVSVTIVAGRYNIMAWLHCRNNHEIRDFIVQYLGAIPAIVNAEAMPTMEFWKSSYAVLADNPYIPVKLGVGRHVDAVDIALICELEADAMQPNVRLARKLGLSLPTVRKRLQRLLEEHIVRVVAVTDSYTLGYTASAGILIKARPGAIEAVATRLASYPRMQLVLSTYGAYDIFAWGTFRDNMSLYTFIRKELDGIPAINSYETLICLEYWRYNFGMAHYRRSLDDVSAAGI